jgi:hypothetical protein
VGRAPHDMQGLWVLGGRGGEGGKGGGGGGEQGHGR